MGHCFLTAARITKAEEEGSVLRCRYPSTGGTASAGSSFKTVSAESAFEKLRSQAISVESFKIQEVAVLPEIVIRPTSLCNVKRTPIFTAIGCRDSAIFHNPPCT